ncbi:energy transducer TonB [Desulfuromonas sp. DDH964]|uniref:energy transducer TonB n=1 Tax=Desulfuromonas sp. DDH964 TaxID=1823759 RepID=UPI000831B710|nr:TonB family protein [Desulfuromonas sp. DDH964]
MDLNHRADPLLIGFLILSLLLHLLLLYLVPRHSLLPATPVDEPPVVVEMRPTQPRERELELPETPNQPRTKPAQRLGPSDQQVEKETAPRGADFEDRKPQTPAQPLSPRPQTPATPAQPVTTAPAKTEPHPAQSETAPAPEAPLQPSPPSLEKLITLPQSTAARTVNEAREKAREEVAEGNAVWLDTEQDLLNSFFRRLKDGIYRVWNYPPRAAEAGQEGVCLLKITFRRDGTVLKVELKESSGSPLLDNEAIAAVRRGGPYGELPRSYKEDQLNVFAFFRYSLLRSHSTRFGDIFGNN